MNRKLIRYLLLSILVVCVSLSGYFFYENLKNEKKTMTYNSFIDSVNQKKVDEVIFLQDADFLYVKSNNETYKIPNPKTDGFIDFLMKHNVLISYSDAINGTEVPFTQIIAVLVLIGVYFLIRHKRNGNGLIKNTNASNNNMVNLMLTDVAGNIEAKAMVDDVIQFIQNPKKYNDLGAKMPRGILFYGPPGTGKTLMAKAIAGEAHVPFYPMSGSDFIQMYVGVGASRVRDLFKKAKKAEKAVIFIDEIDAIGKRRQKQSSGGNDERDQTLNALLTEMSGFNEREGIIVIAATNRLDTLDEALTRPGRFDRLIEIGLPDVNARKKILELHASEKPIADTVDLEALSKSTVSFSGAMLENLLNEAAILAANECKKFIEPSHIDKAFYMVIAGAEKADTSYITPHDRKITAYHEAGHALMTKLLLPDNYISKVTIIPSVQGAGGFSLSIPKDTLYMTKKKLIANIMVLLAGRVTEEFVFGKDEITTGASNDIEKASKQIMDFIVKYGMDEEFGLFNSNVLDHVPNEKLIDLCRTKLNELYIDTKKEIMEHEDFLHNIAHALLEKESLNATDIETLCA